MAKDKIEKAKEHARRIAETEESAVDAWLYDNAGSLLDTELMGKDEEYKEAFKAELRRLRG